MVLFLVQFLTLSSPPSVFCFPLSRWGLILLSRKSFVSLSAHTGHSRCPFTIFVFSFNNLRLHSVFSQNTQSRENIRIDSSAIILSLSVPAPAQISGSEKPAYRSSQARYGRKP